jgi:adenylate cyclase
VIDAVQCAVEIQKELETRNAELSEDRKVEFRIGINLGDVIEKDEDLHGDGVNIAARIESLAEGGGICISRTAFDQVRNKLKLGYEYIGEHSVKNIAQLVRVYRVLMEPDAVGKVIGEKRVEPRRGQKVALAVVSVLLLVVGGLLIWRTASPPVEVASVKKMAFPLPDKPSIAVLPFVNLSNDASQEYFADGLTEQIISTLSKISSLFVIARNSTFTYKGKPVKVKEVSEELGVRNVLEGSVQKSGDRVRITAQLVDAVKGNHLWSETYDRDLKDIFALQDDITKKILTALQVKLTRGEQARVWAKGTDNLEAYLKFMQARDNALQANIESNALAQQMAEEAISSDPEYANAYVTLGRTHFFDVFLGSSKSPKDSIAKAMELTKKALSLDESSADAHSFLGVLYTVVRQHDKGVAEAERAVALDPNFATAHQRLGWVLRFAGRPEEAISAIKKAIRLNPFPPGIYYHNLAFAFLFAGQCEKATAACEKALRCESDNLFAHIAATVAYSMYDREEEARVAATGVLRINPKFSCNYYAKKLPYKNQADIDRYIGALRKAGLK